MKIWIEKVVPVILAGALVLTGCGAKEEAAVQPAKEKEITLMLPFKSGKLDPSNDFTPVRAGVTETLVKLDDDLQLRGWLAEKWEAKDDRTWVFTIRSGVTFHDGTKADAAAVKRSLERAMKASKTVAAALQIEAMQADGQVLTVQTKQPHPALPSELVNPYTSIIQAQAEEKTGTAAFNEKPVGTGPFQVQSFQPNVSVQLARYEKYWGGEPKLKKATVKFSEDANVRALALQSGEADIVYNPPAEGLAAIEAAADLKVQSKSGLRVHFLLFNQQKETMKNQLVREALDLLVNRDSVVQDIMAGHAAAANGPFNNKLPFGNSEQPAKQDITKAKALLEQAGFTAGADGKLTKDGKPLTLELVTYKGRPELPLIAQLLQSDAAKAGITVRITMVENVDAYLKENTEWDMVTYSNLTAPRGDGSYFLNAALLPQGALNAGGINIPVLNEVIEELNVTSGIKQRARLTQEAVSLISQQRPHSYIVYPNIIVGMKKSVTGWTPGREEYYMLTHTLDVK